jgi:hypothetical protein
LYRPGFRETPSFVLRDPIGHVALRIEVDISHCRQDISGGSKQAFVYKTIDPFELGTSGFFTSRTVATNAPVPIIYDFEQANFEILDGAARPSCASSA